MANPIKEIQSQINEKFGENPSKKLELLEKGKNSGIISDDEYKKEKTKIEQEISEFENKIRTKKLQEPQQENTKHSSEKNLIIASVIIIVLFAAVLGYVILSKEDPKTIEELHIENLKGNLDPDFGYVYKDAYSFIKYDGQWFTQLSSPKGIKEYGIAMRYSPRDLENISISGGLNTKFFDVQQNYYVTFNPNDQSQQYTVLAVADLNTHLTKIFEKIPIAACDRNETAACARVPVVKCNNESLVFYFKQTERSNVIYNGTCVIVEGRGFDLVRGIDRILYNLYGIMDQK